MDKMVIVIIDSGVYKNHTLFKNDIIEEYIYSDENNSFEKVTHRKNCLPLWGINNNLF